MLPTESQILIDAFLAGVRAKQIERSESALVQLQRLAAGQTALQPWCLYLAGILANERDHDSARAERLFQEVLGSQPPPEPDLTARLHLALGMTYWRQGRWLDALSACGHASETYAVLDDPVGQAKTLKLMTIVRCEGFDRGDLDPETLQTALAECLQGLNLLQQIAEWSVEVRWLAGTLWNELGAVHRTLGQWQAAIECYQRYREIAQALDHRFGVGLATTNIAESYARQGTEHWSAALEAFSVGLPILHEVGHRPQEIEALTDLAFLHRTMGEHALALHRYEQVIASLEELRAGISSEAARAGYRSTVEEIYAHALLSALSSGRTDLTFDLTERARSRTFLDLLAFGSAQFKPTLEAQTLSLAQVQAALEMDEIMVEYFTMGALAVTAGRRQPSGVNRNRFPPAKTLIVAVMREAVQVIDADLSPNDLQPRRLAGAAERHFLQPAVRRALYDRLIAPAASLLAGKRRLYLVPHGPLHYVPFQALIAPDGETLLRHGGPELVYGPSASVLFRDRTAARPLGFSETPRVSETTLPCLALGFDGEGGQRLRFAEEEAGRIAALLGGEALIGPAGKREALFQRGPAARYLHISCHGQFDPAAPLESSLHLGAGEMLTASEVLASLRLNCDLVTLSACESGLSQVRRGDELMGLVRAFMAAGAPAVLATLWRVDERSTRLLMERFYREVAAGASFAQALQQAQLFLRTLSRQEALALLGGDAPGVGGAEQPFADPFYWAPFVLIGDG